MAIRIPENQRGSLKQLIEMSDEDFRLMIKRLNSLEPLGTGSALASRVVESTQLSKSTVEAIFTIVGSLNGTRERHLVETDKLVNDVLEEVKRLDIAGADKDQKISDALKERLTQLLASDCLRITLKALALRLDYKSVFHSGRFITDLRPIYSENLSDVSSFIILHNLKIEVFDQGRNRTEYIALDTDDLRNLKLAIDRALKKEQALRTKLKATNLNLLEFLD